MWRLTRMVASAAVSVAVLGCSDLDPRDPAEYRHVSGGRAREAPRLLRDYGCHSCHTIPGVRGADAKVGPTLAGFASRRYIGGRVPNDAERLVRWIVDPQGVKPGTAMPNLGVSGEHARHIAAYLHTLR